MATIQIFKIKDVEINIMLVKKVLTYTFEKNGKTYGNAVNLQSNTRENVVSATFQLLANFLETYEAIPNENG